jgi:hypothetical protein
VSEYYKIIADIDELKWFWEYIVPPLDKDSVYFMSLSARNKMLSKEEREYFGLGRTEMIHKQILRKDDYDFFIERLRRYECNIEGLLTKNKLPIPQKTLVVYWNLIPTSVRKCIADSQKLIIDLQEELTNAALKNSIDAIDSAYHKLRKAFDSTISLYARNFGPKTWVDFDVDITHNEEFIATLKKEMQIKCGLGNYAILKSYGGYHVLVKKDIIKWNPNDIINIISIICETLNIISKEIIKNDNYMIPLPGTFMYKEFIPTIINKEDFSKDVALHQII